MIKAKIQIIQKKKKVTYQLLNVSDIILVLSILILIQSNSPTDFYFFEAIATYRVIHYQCDKLAGCAKMNQNHIASLQGLKCFCHVVEYVEQEVT